MNRKHMNGCCGCGSTGPPPFPPIPGCLCTAIPMVLRMVPNAFCGQLFQACTLRYGPKPAELADLPLGAYCFLSDESFYDDLTQSYYRWYLACNASFFGIRRAFLPANGDGAFLDATMFVWAIGIGGSVCTPFRLDGGQIFPGGFAQCQVVISE